MKITDIKVGMHVRVSTPDSDFYDDEYKDEYEGEEGKVLSISSKLPYPIEVDLGFATEYFKPEELEEF